jgi:hypothetical protein
MIDPARRCARPFFRTQAPIVAKRSDSRFGLSSDVSRHPTPGVVEWVEILHQHTRSLCLSPSLKQQGWGKNQYRALGRLPGHPGRSEGHRGAVAWVSHRADDFGVRQSSALAAARCSVHAGQPGPSRPAIYVPTCRSGTRLFTQGAHREVVRIYVAHYNCRG